MVRPFQELLVSVHDKPMNIQKEILNDTFERWKGSFEQVDDVLVMGLNL
jgi:hypothetical protein